MSETVALLWLCVIVLTRPEGRVREMAVVATLIMMFVVLVKVTVAA